MQPSNAMILKAHRELSPLETILADFIFMNFVKVSQDLNPQRKPRTQVRMGRTSSRGAESLKITQRSKAPRTSALPCSVEQLMAPCPIPL